MKENKLIIFDFDGTLATVSMAGLCKAYMEVARYFKKDCPFKNEQEFKKWWKPNWIENEHRLGIKPENQKLAREIFYKVYDPYTKPFSWVKAVIETLLDKGHCLTILTNGHKKRTLEILGGFSKYFLEIIGAEELKGQLKPNPYGVNLILKRTSFAPQDTLLIGDMATDLLAGKGAGIKTGVVCWGAERLKKLLAHKPDYIFFTPDSILRIQQQRRLIY